MVLIEGYELELCIYIYICISPMSDRLSEYINITEMPVLSRTDT